MCFSAQADLAGGVVIGAIGVDVLRHLDRRRDHLALACLPLLFAAHQLDETLVWWGLQGHIRPDVGHAATWVYLIFAFVVLPVYVPVAVLALEPPGRSRARIAPFAVLGAIVSAVLLAAMLRGPVAAQLGNHHLSYSTGLRSGGVIVAAYVLATCGALLFSGFRSVAVFGIVNLIAVAVLARFTIDGFASLWCGWAAVTSAAIALQLRLRHPNQRVTAPIVA